MMTPEDKDFDKIVTELFNSLGNEIIEEKTGSDKFNFVVKTINGENQGWTWIIQVYSDRPLPKNLKSTDIASIQSKIKNILNKAGYEWGTDTIVKFMNVLKNK